MLVKCVTFCTLALILTLTPAAAAPYVLDVAAPSLVVLDSPTAAADLTLLDPPTGAFGPIVIEASPSHVVLAVEEPGSLWLETPDDAEVVATLTRVRIAELEIVLTDGSRAVARSFYPIGLETKEEDHDIDPAPKSAAKPLFTMLVPVDDIGSKEEDHDIDPAPKHGDLASPWAADWSLATAAIAELGPGWYFVVHGDRVSYEILFNGR